MMSVTDHEATFLNLVYFHDTLTHYFLTLTLLTWRILWVPNNASRWQMWFRLAFKGLITCTLNAITKLLDRQFDTSQGLENFPSPFCSEYIWHSPIILHTVTTVLGPRVHKFDHLPHPVSAFRICEVQLHILHLPIL